MVLLYSVLVLRQWPAVLQCYRAVFMTTIDQLTAWQGSAVAIGLRWGLMVGGNVAMGALTISPYVISPVPHHIGHCTAQHARVAAGGAHVACCVVQPCRRTMCTVRRGTAHGHEHTVCSVATCGHRWRDRSIVQIVRCFVHAL